MPKRQKWLFMARAEPQLKTYLQSSARTSCIDDREILEIVRIAKDVEQHFGAPQDMEWVVDKRFCLPGEHILGSGQGCKVYKKRSGEG